VKILIDIGHPAHVHFFSRFAREMLTKGHEILFTSREKDVTIDLLKYYKFQFISLGKTKRTIIGTTPSS